MKDITTFDEHLEGRYGKIGSERRTEFEIKAKSFAIGEIEYNMKDLVDIREIEKIQQLDNEYDLQKALMLDRKLRLMVKKHVDLKPVHDKLVQLILDYEEKNWSDSENISDTRV